LWVLVTANVVFASNPAGQRAIWFEKGSDATQNAKLGFVQYASCAQNVTGIMTSVIVKVTNSDSIRVRTLQNSGNPLNMETNYGSTFTMFRLRTPSSYFMARAGTAQPVQPFGEQGVVSYWSQVLFSLGITQSNGVFVVSETGWYEIRTNLLYASSPPGFIMTWLIKNSITSTKYAYTTVTCRTDACGTMLATSLYLNVGETIQVYTAHSSGAPQLLDPSNGATFSIIRLLPFTDL
jgi:hypothetical protein